MTITYVGAGTEATPVASGGNLLVPYPAGLAAGDVLVMLTMASVSTAWATGAATGFTRHATGTAGGSSPSAAVYFKIATGSETGSLTVTSPGGTSFGRMFAYRGVDNTTTFDTTDGTFASSTAVTAYDITTQTTTVTGAMLGNFVWSNASTGSFTPATQQSGYTELWDSNGGAASTVMEYAHVVSWGSSGATGTRNVVRSAGVRGGGIGFALRPAGAQFPASGTVAGTSSTSGAAAVATPASGEVDASSSTSGSLGSMLLAIAGAAAAVSTAVGAAGAIVNASGTAAATSGVSGSAGFAVATSGEVDAVSGVSGAALLARPAAGTVAATSSVSGSAGVIAAATGAVPSTSGTSGAAGLVSAASGSVAALSGLSGQATALYVVAGSAAAVSDVSGSADVLHPPIPVSFRITGHLRGPAVRGHLRVPALSGHLRVEIVEGDTE